MYMYSKGAVGDYMKPTFLKRAEACLETAPS
jgi:hypothetical protein